METQKQIIDLSKEVNDAGSSTFLIKGNWDLRDLTLFQENLLGLLTKSDESSIDIKIDEESKIDAAVLRKLIAVRKEFISRKKSAEFNIISDSDSQRRLLSTIAAVEEKSEPPPVITRDSLLVSIGRLTCDAWNELFSIVSFVTAMIREIIAVIAFPSRFRPKEIISQLDQTGFYAVPICALVTFLIGIVVTYLTGNQLQMYGANIFVVDGVAIAMCRELSPILVAIIVAGRSGSAFAAQLGTMKLNQEVEALNVMGLSSYSVLILPRVFALMIVMPLLVIVGDVSGIIGGMFISYIQLEVSPQNFIDRLYMILPPRHFFVGFFKAPLYALFIASIACRLGLSAEPNSLSIGINTTKTVVQSIVSVILLNAIIAVILSELEI